MKTGTLTVQSTSSNTYRIYVDGVPKMDLPGNESVTRRYCDAKPTTIRVQQLEGYIFPTDKTYSLNIQCGGSFNVTYP
jgi:CTP-dependent riboflavin kinase